jgi:hypothetical protein
MQRRRGLLLLGMLSWSCSYAVLARPTSAAGEPPAAVPAVTASVSGALPAVAVPAATDPDSATLSDPVAPGDSPPSDASIQELLAVTDARHLIDGLKVQVDAMVSSAMQQARQGKPVTPDVQAVLDRMHEKMLVVADETLNWDTMQGICIRTYRASFTQDELDSIIAFYKTAAGQALVKKMPLVLRNVMTEMQGATALMREKIRQIQLDTMNQLNSLPAAKPTNSST